MRGSEAEDVVSVCVGGAVSDGEAWDLCGVGDEFVDIFNECLDGDVCLDVACVFAQAGDGDLFFAHAFEKPELLSGEAEERGTVQIGAEACRECFEDAGRERRERHGLEEIDREEAQEFL